MWFAVTIEARKDHDGPAVTDDAIDAMFELVQEHAGTLGAEAGGDRWEATVDIDARHAAFATVQGEELIRELAGKAGLPDWPAARVVAVREDVQEEDLSAPTLPDLVSAPEAGEILGVAPQRVHQLATDDPEFPEPLYRLRTGKIWDRHAIKAYGARRSRKPGRPARGTRGRRLTSA